MKDKLVSLERVKEVVNKNFMRLPDEIDSEYTPEYRQVCMDITIELDQLEAVEGGQVNIYHKAVNDCIDMLRTLIKKTSICDVLVENIRDMESIEISKLKEPDDGN